jgi:hypothetical protein
MIPAGSSTLRRNERFAKQIRALGAVPGHMVAPDRGGARKRKCGDRSAILPIYNRTRLRHDPVFLGPKANERLIARPIQTFSE